VSRASGGYAGAGPLAGASGVARLLHSIVSDPSAPLTGAVIGAGGTGKTAVLDAVAEAYGKAGVELLRTDAQRGGLEGRLETDKVVLVDDAHRLDVAVLARLGEFAGSDQARIVLAYRPWPASRELSTLGARAARQGATVVVGHLDRSAVGARIRERSGAIPPESLVEVVHEQAGGLPVLVDIVTRALVDSGRYDPRRPDQFRRPERISVSSALAERLRHVVDALDAQVHRLLEAMAVGATLETEVLAPLLGLGAAELTHGVEAARATGLLTEAGGLIPFVRNLLLRLTPVLHTRELQRRLAAIQLDRGGSVLEAGRQMLGTGAGGSRIATIFEAAGDEAATHQPALACELYTAAVEAGMPSVALAARRARAVALAGDLGQALRLADEVISDPTAPGREQGVGVAAVALAHRGLLARSADLLRRLPADAGGGAVLAVPALIGIGALEDAIALVGLMGEEPGPATLLGGAARMTACGVVASVTGSAPAALSLLARAAVLLEPVAAQALLPDTPAALASLVAMHCGEFAVAEVALRRAAVGKLGGRAAELRHALLYGWLGLLRGQLPAARLAVGRARRSTLPLEPRDELLATALAVGVERRAGDLATLAAAWRQARTALVHHPVDLYTLLPLGELAVAAARLGEREWIASDLAEAWRLLDRLGGPALWAAPLHWYELHAAVAADERADAERHAQALAQAATVAGPLGTALAAGAASWVQLQWGEIDPDAVVAAARRLHELDLPWDGAHLAGQAAARASDRRAVAALHSCARALFPTAGPTDALPPSGEQQADAAQDDPGARPAAATVAESDRPPAETIRTAPPRHEPDAVLSEREVEIGQLVLAGLTYKQIGQRLFISAKTVEHHVARMRQRLGVTSRNEFFARLRELVGEPSVDQ